MIYRVGITILLDLTRKQINVPRSKVFDFDCFLKDFTHLKNAVWGVTTRNREQNFAMNMLTDPEIDFVTLAGTAGTGKTLMALAAGLTQVLDDRRYTEIIMTRATVSVGEDMTTMGLCAKAPVAAERGNNTCNLQPA